MKQYIGDIDEIAFGPLVENWMKQYNVHTPPYYRCTEKHLRLVMTLIALCRTLQSRAPNIECCASKIWPWPWPLTLTPTWPWPLTLNPTWPWLFTLTLKQGNSDVKTWFFIIWHWPSTCNLDPQSLPCNGQLRPPYQKSRSILGTRLCRVQQRAKRVVTSQRCLSVCL